MILAEAAAHASLWAKYVAVLTDPGHVLNELTMVVLVDLLLFPFGRLFINRRFKRRDADHGHDGPEGCQEGCNHCNHQPTVVYMTQPVMPDIPELTTLIATELAIRQRRAGTRRLV